MPRSSELTHKAVTLEAAEGTPAAPSTLTDGEDVTTWRDGKQAPRLVKIKISAAGSCNLSGAWLDGWDGAAWFMLAKIQNGETIALTATLGWAETFADIGTFDRLAVHGTLSESTITVTATPVEVL